MNATPEFKELLFATVRIVHHHVNQGARDLTGLLHYSWNDADYTRCKTILNLLQVLQDALQEVEDLRPPMAPARDLGLSIKDYEHEGKP